MKTSTKRYILRMAYAICVVGLIFSVAACASSLATPGARSQVGSSDEVEPRTLSATIVATDSAGRFGDGCGLDSDNLSVALGWKLEWQHVFDHPIARPPLIVNGSQIILLEREDPTPGRFKDRIWVFNPEQGIVQWKLENAPRAVARPVRWVRDIKWSDRYLVARLQYQDPPENSVASPDEYVVVKDLFSGQDIYSTRMDVLELAVADDALYYRSHDRKLHRINLPSGEHLWEAPWIGSTGFTGIFLVGSSLYTFNVDQHVYQYNPLDGTLIATQTLEATPILGDIVLRDQIAVSGSVYGYKGVTLFDFRTFAPRWKTAIDYAPSNEAFHLPSITLAADAAYLFDAQNNLVKLDLATGQEVWSSPLPRLTYVSRPVVVHDFIHGLFTDGTIRAFSLSDGSEIGIVTRVPLWRWNTSNTQDWRDVIGGLGATGDTLVVSTGCRSVYAIGHDN